MTLSRETPLLTPRRMMTDVAANFFVLVLLLCVGVSCAAMVTSVAHADVGSGSALLPTGDQLHDPLEAPSAAWSDLELAHKAGWPVLVFAVLVLLTKALGYFSAHLASVPVIGGAATWLAQARNAAVIAGSGVIAAALYNVLATGGTWTAALIAGALAIGGILHPTAAPKAS